jgi:multiple sugar transport system permease protein
MTTTATRVIVTGQKSSRRSLLRKERPENLSRPGQRARGRRETLAGYGFLVPWLVGFFGLTIIPMVYSLYLSFTSYNIFSPPRWIGLDNYIRMFTADSRFIDAAWVTFRYVFVSVPLQLGFALAIAQLLNTGLRGLSFYRSVYYLPSLLGSSVAVALLWRQIFGSQGLINQALQGLGLSDLPNWIATPEYALGTLIILNVWTFGSPMIIFLAGLRQVPDEMCEAAAVDGAGPIRRFWSITIPMLSPVIFFNLVLQMIHAFQAFTQAYIVSGGNGGPVDSTLFYTLYLYQKAFTDFDMGYASAMAWVLLVVIGLFTWLAFGTSKRWVHYAGEK